MSAAKKAKEEQEYSVKATHLKNLNQPKTRYDDDNRSLDDDELFEGMDITELPSKPLLSAAKKAKEEQEYSVKATHLKNLNQPKTRYDDDNRSLDDDELFEGMGITELPSKPLLSAAKKAKEEQEYGVKAIHLKNLNQPKTRYDDDNRSLDDDEIFEGSGQYRTPIQASVVSCQEGQGRARIWCESYSFEESESAQDQV